MKKKIFYLFMTLVFATVRVMAQEDKEPVAENDYAEAMALETIEVNVTENDFAYENHPFEIFLVFGGENGTVTNTDSTITYTPNLTYAGIDSISYNIKDLDNNLVSEFAKVYIEVINHGFVMLDVNQVSCRINSFGIQYWDFGFGPGNGYEVPKGSGNVTIFNKSTWIGGLDENGELHLGAERYRQVGADFFQGPGMDSASYSEETDVIWNRVWKLSSDEVAFHRQHWQDEGYTPNENIAGWPGNGDTQLGQAEQLAPYYDWNNNQIYDPENGDFPLIKGDLTVYHIYNDARDVHTESGGKKLGVEVHEMYYAYDQPDDSASAYTTFCDKQIINRSGNNYTDVLVASFLDFDAGYFLDDFVCCDTILESAIVYNSDEFDGDSGFEGYGEHPPAQSFTCLNYTMDGFYYFFSYGQPAQMLDPSENFEYYNYLNGRWRDSTFFTYGGNGYGGTEPVNHIFTGDPLSATGWTEMESPTGPGDRRGLIVSGPHNLNAGDTIHLESALVFARDYNGNHLSSVALLKTRIQEVRDFYQSSLGVEDICTHKEAVKIYPNPCKDYFHIELAVNQESWKYEFAVIDLLGNIVRSGKLAPGFKTHIDLNALNPGIYFIRISDRNNQITKKIIIQSS